MTTLKDINHDLDDLDSLVEKITVRFSPNKYSAKKKPNYDWLYDKKKTQNFHPAVD